MKCFGRYRNSNDRCRIRCSGRTQREIRTTFLRLSSNRRHTIAEAAATNKTTLYRHFNSKDELIIECLRSRAEEGRQFWAEIEASSPEDGLAQLRFWVGRVAMRLVNDCRGCEFTNAAVELTEEDHPARKFVGDIKTEYRDWLAKLCRKAGIPRGELLADTLSLLLEGARTSRQSVGPEGP